MKFVKVRELPCAAVAPDEVLNIGDTPYDAQAAVKAQLRTVCYVSLETSFTLVGAGVYDSGCRRDTSDSHRLRALSCGCRLDRQRFVLQPKD